MKNETDLRVLRIIGHHLEKAIGLADAHDETLVAVHIDEAMNVLGARMAQIRGWHTP